jgi:hypothetical protein
MALVIKDRVKETTTSTGTGTITLAGAVLGYQSFAAIGNTNVTYYAIVDTNNGDWEVGYGTYTSSGTTLSRTSVLASSTGGALIDFAAGTKEVICTYPAEKALYEQVSGETEQAVGPVVNAQDAFFGKSTHVKWGMWVKPRSVRARSHQRP